MTTYTPSRAPKSVDIRKRLRCVAETGLSRAWSLRPSCHGNRIIYYHSVTPEGVGGHTVVAFDAQLRWLADHGYRSVRLSEVRSSLPQPDAPQPWVAITFDDGYADNLKFALPVLHKYGFTATCFVVAGMVGESRANSSNRGYKLYPNRDMLTAPELRELAAEGVEVGSHSYTHRQASELAALSPESLLDDLSLSRSVLTDLVGQSILSFSYPNGQRGAFSPETRALVHKAGYTTAATTMWGRVKPSSDILALPRCEIAASDSLQDFISKMTGGRDYRSAYQRLFDRSRVWY